MNNDNYIRIFVLFVMLVAGVSVAEGKPVPDKPNIVFIFIDDMGFADPSCF